MATTTDERAPRVPPSPNSMAARFNAAPALERHPPIVRSVTDALDDLGCAAERLDALLRSAVNGLGEIVEEEMPAKLRQSLEDVWMFFVIAGEKFGEVREVIGAVTEKVYADRRGVEA